MFIPIFNFPVSILMKKLLSVYCCVLCFRSFQTVPSELANSSLKRSGEKVLVKALTALVNREENKKLRSRRIDLSSSESPWL
jgi:hypothetical protein